MILMKIKRALWIIFGFRFSKFGKKSVIYKPMMVTGKKYIEIGNRVTFRNFARIEVIDKWKEQTFTPKLIIGDGTSFEQNLHLTCAGDMIIGKNCTFTGNIMISNIIHSFDTIDRSILLNDLIVKPVIVGDNCFIGYGAKIMPGVKLGNNCIVGAGSVVTKTFPSYSIVAGNPAKIIKKYDFDRKEWVKVDTK